MAIRCILLDIEGTIIPATFVRDVLFPYAKKHIASFLHDHRIDPQVRQWAAVCHETIAQESGVLLSYENLAGVLSQWIEGDRKHQGLKALQGMIWEEGYRTGAFVPELYDDVAPSFRRWRQEGLTLAMYSSGSEQAQRLLLAHTTDGDLNPMISHCFDTGIGPKINPASYRHIADRLGLHSKEVLFFSDADPELDAATTADLQAIHVVRPGTHPSARHPCCSTLDELRKTDMPLADVNMLAAPLKAHPPARLGPPA